MKHLIAAIVLLAAVAGPAGAEAGFWIPPKLGANVPTRVVAVGDSITLGVLGDGGIAARPYPLVLEGLLSPRHPGVEVRNEGVGGLQASEVLVNLPGILDSDRPIAVLIMAGTNDATFGHTADDIVSSLEQMVTVAKARGVIPILASITRNFRTYAADAESTIESVNARLPAVAAAEGIRFVDMFGALDDPSLFQADGLHPSQDGYELMGAAWQPAVDAALDDALTLLPRAYVLRFNKETFRPGEQLQVDLTLVDTLTSGAVDVYFGLFLPPQAGPSVGCPIDQTFAFIADDFARVVLVCLADVATRAAPLRADVQFVAPISLLTIRNFWAATLLPGLPTGEYVVFFSVTTAGDPTDVLVSSTHSFTLAP